MPVNFNNNTLFEQGVFELEALVGLDDSSRLRSAIAVGEALSWPKSGHRVTAVIVPQANFLEAGKGRQLESQPPCNGFASSSSTTAH